MKAAAFIQRLLNNLQPIPWLSMTGFAMAMFAQSLLEPPARIAPAIVFYIAAAGFIFWAILRDEWRFAPAPAEVQETRAKGPYMLPLVASLCLAGLAFYLFGGNHFTALNLVLWTCAIILFLYAF